MLRLLITFIFLNLPTPEEIFVKNVLKNKGDECIISAYNYYVFTLSSPRRSCTLQKLKAIDPLFLMKQALKNNEDPLPYMPKTKDNILKSMAFSLVSEFYLLKGDLSGALWYSKKALSYYETLHAKISYASVLSGLGFNQTAYTILKEAFKTYGPVKILVIELKRLSTLAQDDPKLFNNINVLEKTLVNQNKFIYMDKKNISEKFKDPLTFKQKPQQTSVLLDRRILRVFDNGLGRLVHQRIVYVNEKGRKVYSLFYSPTYRHLTVLRTSLVRMGRVFKDVALIEHKELQPSDTRMYFNVSRVDFIFNDIEKGDVLEIIYSLQDVPTSVLLNNYFGSLTDLQDNIPVLQSEMEIYGNGLNIYAPQGVNFKKINNYIQIEAKNLPARIHEPFSRYEAPFAIEVSGFNSWKDLAAAYWKTLSIYYNDNPFLSKEFLKKLSKNKNQAIKQVSNILQSYRYVSILFGKHGYYPYNSREIIERKFGDCKDMTLIGVLMLQAAGVQAEPIIVRTRIAPKVYPGVPSLAFFDHSAIYLPKRKWILDGAAKGILYPLIPSWDQGAQMLRITSKNPVLQKVPMLLPKDNKISITIEIKRKKSSYLCKLNMEFFGLSGVEWLKSDWKKELLSWFPVPSYILSYKEKFVYNGVRALAFIKVKSEDIFISFGRTQKWSSWIRLLNRKTPLQFKYAKEVNTKIKFYTPLKYKKNLKLSSKDFKFEQQIKDNVLIRNWKINSIEIPPQRYPQFRKLVINALEVIDDPME